MKKSSQEDRLFIQRTAERLLPHEEAVIFVRMLNDFPEDSISSLLRICITDSPAVALYLKRAIKEYDDEKRRQIHAVLKKGIT
jgi:hypothetical protein